MADAEMNQKAMLVRSVWVLFLQVLGQRTSGPTRRRSLSTETLNSSKSTCNGFDMEYTLCEYISPQFDELVFHLAKQFIVDNLGYSADIFSISYDPQFLVRGLWFKKKKHWKPSESSSVWEDFRLSSQIKVGISNKILNIANWFRILSRRMTAFLECLRGSGLVEGRLSCLQIVTGGT